MAITAPLKKQLVTSLSEELAPLGFKYHRKTQLYYRVTPYGKDFIQMVYSHPDVGFIAYLNVSIRIDSVEEVLQSVSNEWPTEPEKPWTYTAGNNIGYLSGNPCLKWHIVEEVDIVGAIMSMMLAIRSTALPYFERYSSLDELLTLFSRRDREAETLSGFGGFGPVRWSHLCAIAYLNGRIDIVEEADRELSEYELAHKRKSYNLEEQYAYFHRLVAELKRRWNESSAEDASSS